MGSSQPKVVRKIDIAGKTADPKVMNNLNRTIRRDSDQAIVLRRIGIVVENVKSRRVIITLIRPHINVTGCNRVKDPQLTRLNLVNTSIACERRPSIRRGAKQSRKKGQGQRPKQPNGAILHKISVPQLAVEPPSNRFFYWPTSIAQLFPF